jgi:pSer/pThr/pTyr-binding forkhead associated (FHA) protein
VSPSPRAGATATARQYEVWLEPSVGDPVQVPYDGSPLSIGRHESSHLIISDPACSREHAFVRYEDGIVWLEPRE